MGQVNPALFTDRTNASRNAVILTRVSSTSAARFVVCVHPLRHTQDHNTPATVCFIRIHPPGANDRLILPRQAFPKSRFWRVQGGIGFLNQQVAKALHHEY
jgi:hypothetical protein